MSKYNFGLKVFLQDGQSELKFYGDLAKLIFRNNLERLSLDKKNRYNTDIQRPTAYMVVNQIIVDNFVYLFNCTIVDQSSD